MVSVLWKAFLLLMLMGVKGLATPKIVKNDKEPLLNSNTPFFQPDYEAKPLRILAVFPFKGFSHHIFSETLLLEFARRGHHVTMVSPFPPEEPVPNYNHIEVSDVEVEIPPDLFTFENLAEEYESKDVNHIINILSDIDGHALCGNIFNHTKVKPLLQPTHKFDVFFSEVFGSSCCFAIGAKLQIPSVAMVTTHTIDWVDFTGETFHPAYVESAFLTPTPDGLSSLVERLKNTYYRVRTRIAAHFYMTGPSETVVRDFLGADAPSLQEIRYNISLIMSNYLPGIFEAKPMVPRILPVAGLHLRPPNFEKLPPDLKNWLDSAPNGVVYFSMGSLLLAGTFPEYLYKAFVDAFKELKHLRFVWKVEYSAELAKISPMPDNVLTVKWTPQMEVLAHPNTKAFITHGGLMGTTESIYNGVPMIGMPVFADQPINMFRFQKLGIAVTLDHHTATKEQIVQAITKVTSDASFRQRVKEVTRMFKDRPMSPLDSAIWWTEYIVRNKGAPHLESPFTTMPLWKFALLDVAAVLLAGVSLIFLAVYLIFKRCLLRIQPLHKKSQKKKAN